VMLTLTGKPVLSTASTKRFHSFFISLFCFLERLHYQEILLINHNWSVASIYGDCSLSLGFFSA
jgi:hypothetical protein